MSKGREFWLAVFPVSYALGKTHYVVREEKLSQLEDKLAISVVHVIEHSAYTEALAQIEKLEAALNRVAVYFDTESGLPCGCEESVKLEKRMTIAIKALTSLADWKKENLK